MPGEYVIVQLDRPRRLRYDLNALCALQDLLGDDFGTFTEELPKDGDADQKPISLRNVRALLWAGLVHEDATLTVQDVGRLVGMADMSTVTEALTRAMTHAVGEPEPGNPPMAAPVSTG